MFQLNFPAELKVADTITFCKGSFFVVWSNIGTLQSTSYNQCIAKRSSRKLFEICYVFLSPKKFKFTTWMVMMFCFGSIWCRFFNLTSDWSPYTNSSRNHWLTVQYFSDHLVRRQGSTEKATARGRGFSCVIARINVLLYSHNMILLAKSGIQRLGVCVCVFFSLAVKTHTVQNLGWTSSKALPRFRCFVFNFSPTCHWVQLIRLAMCFYITYFHAIGSVEHYPGPTVRM